MRLLLSLTLLCGCRTGLLSDPVDGEDGGRLCPLDAGAPVSATSAVHCGAALCRPPAVCCSAEFGHEGACVLPEECASSRFACDGPADCGAGSQCCYSPDHGGRCVRSGLCPCHPAWLLLCANDNDCAAREHCCPRGVRRDPPEFLFCTSNPCPL